jgi:hypothetical protein
MAGTVVADTLQNGAGTSTSMDNAINGSAKAWAALNYNAGSAVSLNAGYNVSSVTRNATGDYSINFTTALSDANYAVSSSGAYNAIANSVIVYVVSKTTTVLRMGIAYATGAGGSATAYDYGFSVSVFR